MKLKKAFSFLSLLWIVPLAAQIVSCGNKYGSDADRENTQIAMFYGSSTDVINAINQAKETRGYELGCPEIDYGPRMEADITKPSLAEVETLWNNTYRPNIEAFEIACPELGRSSPVLALGAYFARLAGYYDDLSSLANIGKMLKAQQYSEKYAPTPLASEKGVFGYHSGKGECELRGVPGENVQILCEVAPQFCVTYTSGIYEGFEFGIRDNLLDYDLLSNPTNELPPPEEIGDLGGAGFDMGWATVMMVEAAIQQEQPELKELFKNSAFMAGEWALQQPLATNHNYTSKLVWLLAYLYNWTGNEDFKAGLIDRLNRNLKPGVLMDINEDGIVDGTGQIPFADLHPIAQKPGRNYDGHNALPWYHSMNTWAAVEAYVAFRDRGDNDLAADIRPYAIAMLDNLAHELVNLGLPDGDGPGSRDVPFSLLLAIWKIAQYEGESNPLWEKAAWAIWNQGILEVAGARGLNLGLYLVILSETSYVPLSEREIVLASTSSDSPNEVSIYPNPSNDTISILIPDDYHINNLTLYDSAGSLVKKVRLRKIGDKIELHNLLDGTYYLKANTSEGTFIKRIIKN